MVLNSEGVENFYRHRFGTETATRLDVWGVLCADFFQKWVPQDSTVLDIAAGYCEFSNNIRARRRIAIDLNPDVALHAADGVEVIVGPSTAMGSLRDNSVDVAFTSNFFEHIDRDAILATLTETIRVLRPGGRLMILQPNIRFCAKDYWQFFDHITAIDDRALTEALEAVGYDVLECIERFLPYTTKGKLPATPRLVRWYLKVPLAWRVLGAQSFMVAAKPG